MTENKLQSIAALDQLFEEIRVDYDNEANTWWDSLSQDDQQLAFYSVVKRIYKGEIEDRGSYRHVLYNVFDFDSSAYVMGMDCGFLELHNSIYSQDELAKLRNDV